MIAGIASTMRVMRMNPSASAGRVATAPPTQRRNRSPLEEAQSLAAAAMGRLRALARTYCYPLLAANDERYIFCGTDPWRAL